MAKKKPTQAQLDLKHLKARYEWMDGEYDRLRDQKDEISLRMREMLDDMAEMSADIINLGGKDDGGMVC